MRFGESQNPSGGALGPLGPQACPMDQKYEKRQQWFPSPGHLFWAKMGHDAKGSRDRDPRQQGQGCSVGKSSNSMILMTVSCFSPVFGGEKVRGLPPPRCDRDNGQQGQGQNSHPETNQKKVLK